MLTINVKLALVAVLFVPLLIILIIYSNIRMNRAWRQMYSEIADVNARVEDSVSGVRVVQSFTNERFEISRFLKNNQKFRKAKLNWSRYTLGAARPFHCAVFHFSSVRIGQLHKTGENEWPKVDVDFDHFRDQFCRSRLLLYHR